jgi:hypothetical protein
LAIAASGTVAFMLRTEPRFTVSVLRASIDYRGREIMGREVRRVPADWQHPKAFNSYRGCDEFVPLHEGGYCGGYAAQAAEWDEGWAKWQEGLCSVGGDWEPIDPEHFGTSYTGWAGARPSPDDYMPDWPDELRTHYMMYEDTSEGTPISPAFASPEELARWLADNGASAFANMTATYEQWLPVCRGGFAPSMVVENGQMKSGVEFMGTNQ